MTRVLFLALSLLMFAEMQREAEGNTSRQRQDVLLFLSSAIGGHQVRPDGAGGDGSPVVVTLDYHFNRVLDLDEDSGLLRTAGYLSMMWTDRRLSYEWFLRRGPPNNISSIRLETSQIWIPDIELFNTDSPGLKSFADQFLVTAEPLGQLTWVPQVSFNSFCDQSSAGGPSGSSAVNCTLRFGSWTYSSLDLDLQVVEKADLAWNSGNRQWRIASSSVRRHETHFECCPDSFITIDYTLLLFRQ